MKSDRFGENIAYSYNDQFFLNHLSDRVQKNGFTDYSPQGITSYLTFRHPIGRFSMFSDYMKCPFGNETGDNDEKTVWYPKFGGCKDTLEGAIEKTDILFRESLKKLIQGRKKIAATISGGVDSSLIVAMLRHMHPDMDIHTYCAGFYGDDEFEYARMIAKEKNTIHKEKILGMDDFIGEKSLLSDLIKYKASPLHPNELPLAEVEKLAKEDGCDIVLCGEGSDDIFGGYGQNFRMYLNYDHRIPFFKYFLYNYRYFSLQDREMINPRYLVDDFHMLMDAMNGSELDTDIRNWVFYFTQKIHTPGLITRGANAMRYNGFPLGFPYIDEALVDYVNGLPFEYKVAWKSEESKHASRGIHFRTISEKYDTPKFILKKWAEKYCPLDIIYRPKKGFPVPFEKWYHDLNEWDFDSEVFISRDIRRYSGWKKFMLINLDSFIKMFNQFKK